MNLARMVKPITGKQTSHYKYRGALNWRNNRRKTAERSKRVKINQTKKHPDLQTVRTVTIKKRNGTQEGPVSLIISFLSRTLL